MQREAVTASAFSLPALTLAIAEGMSTSTNGIIASSVIGARRPGKRLPIRRRPRILDFCAGCLVLPSPTGQNPRQPMVP
jgi:hypothetical protein